MQTDVPNWENLIPTMGDKSILNATCLGGRWVGEIFSRQSKLELYNRGFSTLYNYMYIWMWPKI